MARGGYSTDCVVNVTVALEQIRFEENNVVFDGIEKKTFKVLFTPVDATNRNITFSSSNGDVITINESGEAQSISVGDATIIAISEDGGLEATCSCTVNEVPATEIVLDKVEDWVFDLSECFTITSHILPVNSTDKEVVYSLDNNKIAELEDNNLTAIDCGEGNITIQIKGGNLTIQKPFIIHTDALCFSSEEEFTIRVPGGKTWNGALEYYSLIMIGNGMNGTGRLYGQMGRMYILEATKK